MAMPCSSRANPRTARRPKRMMSRFTLRARKRHPTRLSRPAHPPVYFLKMAERPRCGAQPKLLRGPPAPRRPFPPPARAATPTPSRTSPRRPRAGDTARTE
eukprot:723464-Lingulodinium_polyedra.AAC.1